MDDTGERYKSFVAGLRLKHPEFRDEALTPALLAMAADIQSDLMALQNELAVNTINQATALLAPILQASLDDLGAHGVSQCTRDILAKDPVRALHVILRAAYEDVLVALAEFADGISGASIGSPSEAVELAKRDEDDFVLTSKTVAQA